MDNKVTTACSSGNKKHYVDLCATVMEHWGCTITKALPAELAPRKCNPNGSRVAISQYHDRRRLHPKQWTRKFSQKLTLLASNTTCGHEAVLKELAKQVKLRQKHKTHPLHYVRELLTSEIDIVIENFSKQQYTANGGSVEPTEDGFDLEEGAEEGTRDKIERMKELRRSQMAPLHNGHKASNAGEGDGTDRHALRVLTPANVSTVSDRGISR